MNLLLLFSSKVDSVIDYLVLQVLEYFVRDYIEYWYVNISEHEAFLYHLRQVLQRAIITFASRLVLFFLVRT